MFCVKNGLLHTVKDKEPFFGDILLKDGKIASIGNVESFGGVEIIDASGAHIYPGLVEAHCHLGLDGYAVRYEGQDYNERTDPVTPQLEAIDAFNPQDVTIKMAAEAGVTTVGTGPGSSNILGGTFIAVKTYGNRADDMIIKRKAAMKCAFGENPKFCYKEKDITSRMTTAAKLREEILKAKEYIRKKEAAGDDYGKRPPFDFKLEALAPVVKKEIPLKAHAHRADDIFTAIRLAKELDVGLTLEHCTEGHLIAEYLAKEGTPVAVGPTFGHATKFELKNKSFETPGILARAGCEVSIITDSPVIPQQNLALCAAFAIKSGMDEYDALKAITLNPAKHLGVADRVGSLEIGKDADIVVASGSIFDFKTEIVQVFINGKPIKYLAGSSNK